MMGYINDCKDSRRVTSCAFKKSVSVVFKRNMTRDARSFSLMATAASALQIRICMYIMCAIGYAVHKKVFNKNVFEINVYLN